MKKHLKTVVVVLIIVILLAIGIFAYLKNKSKSESILPTSFTINVNGDFTSSGASRTYSGNLTFINDSLISGSESYFIGEGGGCKINCDHKTSCFIDNNKWVDETTGSECAVGKFISLTKEEIEQQIKTKEILPNDQCGHLDLCYEVINI